MKKVILFGRPIIVFIDILIVNAALDLIRQPNDTAVFAGVFIIWITILINALLIQFINKQFKKK